MREKIGVLWDGYGESVEGFRGLMKKGFSALILVDRRFDHESIVTAGVAAKWVKHFTIPMITLPQPQAARLFGHGPTRCHITVGGSVRDSCSTNVIGEIPGREPEAILISGHHDSTFSSFTCDDNLSGVSVALSIAAVQVSRPPQRL